MNKEIEEKIMQLQLLEQNLQNLLSQKQAFQSQSLEIDNALKEIKDVKDPVFKIIGNTMISIEKGRLENELSSKKEILGIKIKNFEKQEKIVEEKFKFLQSEVLKNIKK